MQHKPATFHVVYFRTSVDKKLLESLCSSQNDADIFEDDIAESADWDYTRSFLINVSQHFSYITSIGFNSTLSLSLPLSLYLSLSLSHTHIHSISLSLSLSFLLQTDFHTTTIRSVKEDEHS